MSKCIVPFCCLFAMVFFAMPSRSEVTLSTTRPSVDDRLSAIEAKLAELNSVSPSPTTAPVNVELQLRAALIRINQLEQKVRLLESQLATANTNTDKDTVAAKETVTDAKDTGADMLPQGTHLTGTYTTARGPLVSTASITSRDVTTLTLRIKNEAWTRDYDMQIDGTKVTVTAINSVWSRGPTATLKNIRINGTIASDSISLNGNYIVQEPGGGQQTDVKVDLKVK